MHKYVGFFHVHAIVERIGRFSNQVVSPVGSSNERKKEQEQGKRLWRQRKPHSCFLSFVMTLLVLAFCHELFGVIKAHLFFQLLFLWYNAFIGLQHRRFGRRGH